MLRSATLRPTARNSPAKIIYNLNGETFLNLSAMLLLLPIKQNGRRNYVASSCSPWMRIRPFQFRAITTFSNSETSCLSLSVPPNPDVISHPDTQ